MRIFDRRWAWIPAFAGMTLGACHSKPVDPFTGAAADGAGKIDCRPAGAADFQPVCDIERANGARGLVLTVRQPNGGFHRLLVTKDGRGVVAADGAERANVGVAGDHFIEVMIGGDRYRLPATVKPGAATARP